MARIVRVPRQQLLGPLDALLYHGISSRTDPQTDRPTLHAVQDAPDLRVHIKPVNELFRLLAVSDTRNLHRQR